jgi:hypothetical protein
MRSLTLCLFLTVAALAPAGMACAQDSSTSPFRFGFSAGPTNAPFGSAFSATGRPDAQNPIYADPLSYDRANAKDSGDGPKLGPEGSGTPMSRGGVNDTLTGYHVNGGLFANPAPAPSKDGKAKAGKAQTAKSETAKPETAKPETAKPQGTKPQIADKAQ